MVATSISTLPTPSSSIAHKATELTFPAEQLSGTLRFPHHPDWIITPKAGSTIAVPESACALGENGVIVTPAVLVLADVEIKTPDGHAMRFDRLPVEIVDGSGFNVPSPQRIFEQASLRRAA